MVLQIDDIGYDLEGDTCFRDEVDDFFRVKIKPLQDLDENDDIDYMCIDDVDLGEYFERDDLETGENDVEDIF